MFRLMLITDWSQGLEALLSRVKAVLASGVAIAVQHRHPEVSTRVFFDEAQRLAALCAQFEAPLFINTRLDVALALGAHLHLPTHALSAAHARAHLPRGRLISHAVHSIDEAQPEADFALVSPVFAPRSKPNDTRPTLGVDGFHAIAAQLPYPAFALGGITAENARLLTGAAGFALINGLTSAEDALRLSVT